MRSSPTVRRAVFLVTAIYWLGIFTLTHLPARHLPQVKVNDKIEHLLAYGGLGTLLFISLWIVRPQWTHIGVIVLAIGMIYGAIDEWLQALPFVNRDCDFLDWTADTTALAIVAVVMTFVRSRLSAPAPPAPVENGERTDEQQR